MSLRFASSTNCVTFNPNILLNVTQSPQSEVFSKLNLSYIVKGKAKTNTRFISQAAHPNYIPHISNVINLDNKRFACYPSSTTLHHRSYFTRALRTAVLTLAENVTSISLLGKNPENPTNPVTCTHPPTIFTARRYHTINQLHKTIYIPPPPPFPQQIQKDITARARSKVRLTTEPLTMPQTTYNFYHDHIFN